MSLPYANLTRTTAVDRPPVTGELVTGPATDGLTGPKVALIESLDQALTLVLGNVDRLPFALRTVVVPMLRSQSGMAFDAVRSMDDAQVRGIVQMIADRATAALADDTPTADDTAAPAPGV